MSKCKEKENEIVKVEENEKDCCCKDKKKKNKKKCCKCKRAGYEAYIRFKTHKGGSFKISVKVTAGLIFTVFLSLTGFVLVTKHALPGCKTFIDVPDGKALPAED